MREHRAIMEQQELGPTVEVGEPDNAAEQGEPDRGAEIGNPAHTADQEIPDLPRDVDRPMDASPQHEQGVTAP